MVKTLSGRLAGLSALACVACCALPALIAAGVVGGGLWAWLGGALPAIAVGTAVAAAGAWWWADHRCSCGTSDCAC